MKEYFPNKKIGFTIVELLVVIVIMGILVTLGTVSYRGVMQKSIEANLQADLDSAKNIIKKYYEKYYDYPASFDASNCPLNSLGVVDANYCLQPSSDNTYSSYTVHNDAKPPKYSITVTNASGASESFNKFGGIVCPTGFIPVPGSSTYGTNDFCIMKYEAKADDNGDGTGDTTHNTGYDTWDSFNYPISSSRKLVSSAAGYPVVSIAQVAIVTYNPAIVSTYVYGCNTSSSCHLVSEAEWMTLIQNILSVDTNWSGGTVGSGYIYSGHNDGAPFKALVADNSDDNGYVGETNTGGNQKRTLELTNGEVIWDIAGNVWELTSGQVSSAIQPGVIGNAYSSPLDWPSVTNLGALPINASPSGTGISGAGSWTSINGIGKLLSNPSDTELRAFMRGGDWYDGVSAGVMRLKLSNSPEISSSSIGFRVAALAL